MNLSASTNARPTSRGMGAVVLACFFHLPFMAAAPLLTGAIAGQERSGGLAHSPGLVGMLVAVGIAALMGVGVIGWFVARRTLSTSAVVALPAVALFVLAQAVILSTDAATSQLAWRQSLELYSVAGFVCGFAFSTAASVAGLRFGFSAVDRNLSGALLVAVLTTAFSLWWLPGPRAWVSLLPGLVGALVVATASSRASRLALSDRVGGNDKYNRHALVSSGADTLMAAGLALIAIACVALAEAAAHAAKALNDGVLHQELVWRASRNGWAQTSAVVLALIVASVRSMPLVGLAALYRRRQLAVIMLMALGTLPLLRWELDAQSHDYLPRSAQVSAVPRKNAVPVANTRASATPNPRASVEAPAKSPAATTRGRVPIRVHEVDGPLALEVVLESLQRRQVWFDECAAKSGPEEVKLRIVVADGGSVVYAKNHGRDSKRAMCVMLALYKVGFPGPSVERANIELSLHFE